MRQSGHVIRLTQFFERRGQLFQPGAPLGYRPPALNLPIRAGEQCLEPLVDRPGVAAFGARLVTGDHLPFAPKYRQGVFQQLASVVGLVEASLQPIAQCHPSGIGFGRRLAQPLSFDASVGHLGQPALGSRNGRLPAFSAPGRILVSRREHIAGHGLPLTP